MLQTSKAHELMNSVQLVELVVEDDPAHAQQLGVISTPTLCAVRRGPGGIEKVWQQAMPRDLVHLLEWAGWTAGLTPTSRPGADAALQRTSNPSTSPIAPSPQVPYAPQQALTNYATAQAFQTIPLVATPTPPPVALAMSSPPVYVQQSPPTIVLGPTPPANVVVAQSAPTCPTVSLAAAACPAPVPATPTPQAPTQATVTMAAQAPAYSVLPQAATAAASTPQTVGMGLILCNPNPIDRMLGAIGRTLAQRGLPRLQMNAATPATFSPTLVPVSQAGVQLAQPQVNGQLYYVQPNAQSAPPQLPTTYASPQQAAPVMASPQGSLLSGQANTQNGSPPSLWSRLLHKN
jgi:hypothetical protein